MKTMAVLDNNKQVVNIIVCADEQDETENLIDYSENNPAHIGGDYQDGYFYAPQPFPSWTRKNGGWEAPKPEPTDGISYAWNEDEIDWEPIDD
jgi:hypothetical protein